MPKPPASPHFTPIDLSTVFNARRQRLPGTLRFKGKAPWTFGAQTLRGMPFQLGQPGAPNVIDLNRAPVELPLDGLSARYLIFLHAAEDQRSPETPSWADDGNPSGDLVSEYVLEYADGNTAAVPIRRRFAIQQMHIRWG